MTDQPDSVADMKSNGLSADEALARMPDSLVLGERKRIEDRKAGNAGDMFTRHLGFDVLKGHAHFLSLFLGIPYEDAVKVAAWSGIEREMKAARDQQRSSWPRGR